MPQPHSWTRQEHHEHRAKVFDEMNEAEMDCFHSSARTLRVGELFVDGDGNAWTVTEVQKLDDGTLKKRIRRGH